MTIRLTRELAFAASLDAANRSMRVAGRKTWNDSDADLATAEFNRLWPLCKHGIEPEYECWLCEEAVESTTSAPQSLTSSETRTA